MAIKKAIIPAAGLGTRFLPATKAQPKEMLPIVDQPTIQYIVEEAVASGIEDIIIVTGRGKRAIEDHFDKSYELEAILAAKGKGGEEQLKRVQRISNMADIHYIRQKEAKGLGHAVWCARKFIGSEPFAVMLGDDVVVADEPCLKQLMAVHERFSASVLGIQPVVPSEVNQYGIVEPTGNTGQQGVYKLANVVEKPDADRAPSNLAIMGRYILQPDIFDILHDLPPGAGGEIQLTDAIRELSKLKPVVAFQFAGKRYDVGNKFGFIQATVDFALGRDDLRQDVAKYLERIVAELKQGQ